ncbi:uncharacterized protein ARMOST_15929 [Armillaria ostoyae]|uniref:Uncharacterized protein n=1 Tax=Armillaria ostoyae TaxID=47428 RepID=A0A284RUT5_ARMOS|nr:uncharacterized protein ARMOST_15929 [Armillaria ostoyae]
MSRFDVADFVASSGKGPGQLADIAYFLCKRDQKSFRAICIVTAPHIFHHLRGLQSLQISNFELYDTPSGFWIELTQQKIYIPCITLKSYSMPSAVIDYLVSNQGMSELSFELEEETDRGDVLKRMLSEVVPRHSRTEVLHLSSSWGSHWTIGHFPGYVAGVSNARNYEVDLRSEVMLHTPELASSDERKGSDEQEWSGEESSDALALYASRVMRIS